MIILVETNLKLLSYNRQVDFYKNIFHILYENKNL